MLEAVWKIWLKHKDTCFAVADVMSPVEARLFAVPYPFIDLSSLLFAKGYDCNEDRQKLAKSNLIAHNAMNDVRLSAKIFHNIFCDFSENEVKK